jgi:hypothetical protein
VEAENPFTPPAAPTLKPLGSLAQSARGKELKQAQGILIAIGLLTLAISGFHLYNLPNEIAQAIEQNKIGADDVDRFRQAVTASGYLIYGLPALLGVVFVIFGTIIKSYPVPITITSLLLYIVATVAFGFLNPAVLLQGLIMKIIIVVALARAIKAAFAYQAHAEESQFAEGSAG